MMIDRLLKLSLCAIVALTVGMATSAAEHLARHPGLWSKPDWIWNHAEGTAIFYLLAPLIVLGIVSLLGRAPSTGLSVLMAVAWLAIIFVKFEYKGWSHFGILPLSKFKLYLGLLPAQMAFGLAFAICARRLLGNDSVKPDA